MYTVSFQSDHAVIVDLITRNMSLVPPLSRAWTILAYLHGLSGDMVRNRSRLLVRTIDSGD